MKAKLTICFYVALLPSIIYGDESLEKCLHDVVKIAIKGGLIEEIFQPQGDGPLGNRMGTYSFVFRGILCRPCHEKEIAMKFTQWDKEYLMYRYLGAIDDEDVEQYGIPAVYYYGKWKENNLTMIGMSLLEKTIDDLQETEQIFEKDLNVLIVLRDFILSSKYMHSHGVRHNDIKLTNIMVRKHRSFIIDFNLGSKVYERAPRGTLDFAARRAYVDEPRCAKDDWESFLYSICHALGARFKWIGLNWSEIHTISALKSNKKSTLRRINSIESELLKEILREFAEHVFDEKLEIVYSERMNGYTPICKKFPDYDRFYKLVNDEIKKLESPEAATFTWLKEPQSTEALEYLQKHPIPDITKIPDPIDVDLSQLYADVDDSMRASAPSSSAVNSVSSNKSKTKKFLGKMYNLLSHGSSKGKQKLPDIMTDCEDN